MDARRNSSSRNSKRARSKKASTQVVPGDQNLVTGSVENGGTLIQGGTNNTYQFNQNINVITASEMEQSELNSPEISIKYYEPETIYIPEGAFWMGSNAGEGIPVYETPRHEVFLSAYRIGKYPVINAQYEVFIHETGRLVTPMMGWDGQRVPEGLENHPVAGVTWYEALAYCHWLSEKTGRKYSLPTEAQWEKACRGGKNFLYPWGDEFVPGRCNHGQPNIAPVDKYSAQNEFGCFDLVGNVRQWTCTLWGEKRIPPNQKYAYPWKDDGRNDLKASREIYRVVRGSSWEQDIRSHRCSARRAEVPELRGIIGFRVAMSI